VFAVFNLLYASGPLRFVIDDRRVIGKVEAILTKLMSIVERRKIEYKSSNEQKNSLHRILKLVEENYNIRYENLDTKEQKKRIDYFNLEVSKIVFGARTDPFDMIEQSFYKSLELPKSYSFIHHTKYDSYRNALIKILEKINSEEHYTKILEFSRNITSREYLGMLQHMRRINITHLRYLDKNRDDLTEGAVEKHISIYDDLSGNLEKYVRFLVWIEKLLKGKIPDYAKIKQDSLSNHVKHLRTQRIFKDLLKPFDLTIRNAVSHPSSIVIDPVSEAIKFIDTEKTVIRSYQNFFNETRELAAACSAISNFGFFILTMYQVQKLVDSEFFL